MFPIDHEPFERTKMTVLGVQTRGKKGNREEIVNHSQRGSYIRDPCISCHRKRNFPRGSDAFARLPCYPTNSEKRFYHVAIRVEGLRDFRASRVSSACMRFQYDRRLR